MFKSLLEEILLLRNPCNQVNNDSTLNKNSHRMTVRIYSKQKKNNATPMETITVTKIQKGTVNEKFDEKYIDCFFF